MKPDVDKLLEVIALQLMTSVAPGLERSYDQSSVGAAGAMLLAMREEVERGAQRRVEENLAVRELAREGARCVEDPALRTRLEEAARGQDDDLRISSLEASNSALRALLIELHAHVEGLESEAARQVDEAIWRELSRSTERRKLSLAVF